MNRLVPFLLASLLAAPALAHEAAKKPAAPAAAAVAADPGFDAAAAVVDRFNAALKAGDFATVQQLLDERVLILESGGAERTRDEYMGHHAIADAAFLAGASVRRLARGGQAQGDVAWVGTESEVTPAAGSDAKPALGTETMVLRRGADGWRIVHIHWSSRTKKTAP